MTKAEARAQYLAQRRALPADDVDRRSSAIADRFFALLDERLSGDTSSPGWVHVFLPIARQNEVDTWLIIHRLWRDYPSVQVAVSVTDTATNLLTHYPLTPTTALTKNRWGIPEPVSAVSEQLQASLFDIVLVPLLAFDIQGHRVGYGKGYYDRFLANCRPDCLNVGLSLFEPIEHIDDVSLTDVRLTACLTPDNFFGFR